MATYSKGKRAKNGKINKSKIVTILLMLIIIIATSYLIYTYTFSLGTETQKEKQVPKEENAIQNAVVENKVGNNDEIVSEVTIPTKVGKYEVEGQLVIEKIGVKLNILAKYSMPALEVSIAHFCGPKINEPGNFCIVGHDYVNMLAKLSNLKKGDTFYMISRTTKKKVNYKVESVYIVSPKDLSCLEQNKDGKREVTIITCAPGGAKRIICKAREA